MRKASPIDTIIIFKARQWLDQFCVLIICFVFILTIIWSIRELFAGQIYAIPLFIECWAWISWRYYLLKFLFGSIMINGGDHHG